MHYPATLTPHKDHPGHYGVAFVDLPGCVSSGETLEDALRMGAKALAIHVGSMLEDGDALPAASSLKEAARKTLAIYAEEGEEQTPGTLFRDIEFEPLKNPKAAYAKKTRAAGGQANKQEAVRLSISLKPAIVRELDEQAEELGLTRSGFLAVAVREYAKRNRS